MSKEETEEERERRERKEARYDEEYQECKNWLSRIPQREENVLILFMINNTLRRIADSLDAIFLKM